MVTTVPRGMFMGFTATQLDAEFAKYVAAVQQRTAMAQAAGGGVIAAGRINGQDVQFAYPAGITSLEEWRQELVNARAQLAGETLTAPDRAIGLVRSAS